MCICFWLFTFFAVAVEVSGWEESEYEEKQKYYAEIKANKKEIAIKEAPLEIVRQMQQLNNNLEKLSQELKFLREEMVREKISTNEELK